MKVRIPPVHNSHRPAPRTYPAVTSRRRNYLYSIAVPYRMYNMCYMFGEKFANFNEFYNGMNVWNNYAV